jgi:hypothetical protein
MNKLYLIPIIIGAAGLYCLLQGVKQHFSGSTDGEGKSLSNKNVWSNNWYLVYGGMLGAISIGIYYWMKSEE